MMNKNNLGFPGKKYIYRQGKDGTMVSLRTYPGTKIKICNSHPRLFFLLSLLNYTNLDPTCIYWSNYVH